MYITIMGNATYMLILAPEGKQPCIADKHGKVLCYADEDKAGLKDKAPTKRRRAGKVKAEVSSEPESLQSGSEASSNDIPEPRRAPPGNVKKRKRPNDAGALHPNSDSATQETIPVVAPTAPRPAVPSPSAPPPEPEMQPLYTMPHHFDPGIQQHYPVPYQPPGYPPAQHYSQPGSYPQQGYPGPFYQQGYPPGPWQPNPPPQPGPAWPAPPTAEELAQLMRLRGQQGRGNDA